MIAHHCLFFHMIQQFLVIISTNTKTKQNKPKQQRESHTFKVITYIYNYTCGKEKKEREKEGGKGIYHLFTHRFKKETTRVNSHPLCSLPNTLKTTGPSQQLGQKQRRPNIEEHYCVHHCLCYLIKFSVRPLDWGWDALSFSAALTSRLALC